MPPRFEIVEYQSGWSVEFAALEDELVGASTANDLVTTNVLRIDHIGSTAVPGLAARDVIDVQITVLDLSDASAIDAAMSGLGADEIIGAAGQSVPGTD